MALGDNVVSDIFRQFIAEEMNKLQRYDPVDRDDPGGMKLTNDGYYVRLSDIATLFGLHFTEFGTKALSADPIRD